MIFQVLERQHRGGLSNRGRKPLDEPIFQNADTTDAALVKVLPKLDQVRWVWQRHLLSERLKNLRERLAVCGLRHIVAREMEIDASPAQLAAEVSDAKQFVGAAQHVDGVGAVGQGLQDVQLIFEAAP